MLKIAINGNWFGSAGKALTNLSIHTPGNTGVWRNIKGVSDPEQADIHVIFQRDTHLTTGIPQAKKIYIQREPDAVIPQEVFNRNRGLYRASYENSFHFTTWWVEKCYSELKQIRYPEKNKNLNTILSFKKSTYGQFFRQALVKSFLAKYPGEIDVYGSFNLPRDHEDVVNWRYPKLDKFACSVDYRYTFVAENSRQPNYFSEKIADAFLSYTMPIYWGCPNLGHYFPKESYRLIDIQTPDAADQLRDLSTLPLKQENIEAIEYARELILDRYNFWPALHNILKRELRLI